MQVSRLVDAMQDAVCCTLLRSGEVRVLRSSVPWLSKFKFIAHARVARYVRQMFAVEFKHEEK